jgi:uncharacterized protein (TIGR02145 family)
MEIRSMKKAILILSAALALVACNKEKPATLNDGTIDASQLVFNFTVKHPDDAKAVKSYWEDGDKVFIFFEDVTTGYVSTTYDASLETWTEPSLQGTAELSASGKKLTAVYLPFGSELTPSYNEGWQFSETQYTYYMVAEKVDYSIEDPGELSATLDMQNPEGYVQFFIPDATDQTLYTDAVIPTGLSSIAADGSVSETTRADGTMDGYSYAGGKLYSGKLAEPQVTAKVADVYPYREGFAYYFILSDGKHYFKFADEALPSHSAIKLPPLSGWVQTGPDYAVEINWATWATVNVGATYPWDLGGYYTWTERDSVVPEGWHLPDFDAWNTDNEFGSLYMQCDVYWTSIKGVYGRIYAEKSNPFHFIFLPATGDWVDDETNPIGYVGERGCYWSSSPVNEYAYVLCFDRQYNSDVYSDSVGKTYSIRLVKD